MKGGQKVNCLFNLLPENLLKIIFGIEVDEKYFFHGILTILTKKSHFEDPIDLQKIRMYTTEFISSIGFIQIFI